jgi:glutathione S-transferase
MPVDGMGTQINKLKSLRLHEALLGAIERGEEDEVLRNGKTVLEAYTKKIAWVRQMESTTGGSGPDIDKKMAENDVNLDAMCKLANDHLATSEPFLFGCHLTSADAFFICVLFRISQVPGALEEQFERYERLRAYWTAVQETEEARATTDYGKNFAFRFMIKNGVPF